jgi:L-lactate dehydrogenase complex protein LldG
MGETAAESGAPMNRDRMLATVRSALGAQTSPERARVAAVKERLAHPPRHPKPAFAISDKASREARFIQALESQGARVLSLPNREELPAAVGGLLESTTPVPRLVIADDIRLTALAWPNTFGSERWKLGDMLGDGTAAISHAWGAVAETGTLVMVSNAASPASLTFLPELHIVALDRKTIAASFEDAFAGLASEFGSSRFPRAVNLVSSPSRTSDIGGRSVRGAHGPRHLAVVLYGDPA